MDGQGTICDATVVDCDRDTLQARIIRHSTASRSKWQITLVQSLIKPHPFEWLVEKATELGVSRLVPVISERSVVRYRRDERASKVDKWLWIAIDAMKQCGNAWLPEIEPPVELDAFASHNSQFDLHLVACLESGGAHIRTAFSRCCESLKRCPISIAIWIGPEGDFSPGELSKIRAAGAIPVSLGPLVLRAETAAVYGLSVLNSELTYSCQSAR
jgi:16S rRNA (uracil1498-N3)-methyltransferase